MIASLAAGSRTLTGNQAEELYLTAAPTDGDSLASQAGDLYRNLKDALDASGAKIFSERIFATPGAMNTVVAERQAVLGGADDGVGPTRILVEPGRSGELAGVQIHAVRSDSPPKPVRCETIDSVARGRELRIGEKRWLMLNELSGGDDVSPRAQAERMFDWTERFLRSAGGDMRSVARTWLWLRDICDWYDDLNATRTAFFKREGLISDGNGPPRLPASTGIGLGGANGSACTLDLIALPGAEETIEFVEAGGDQDSAFAYGSAFSRAAIAPMPGGRTMFISGTAAIDDAGRTEHVGQIEQQIEATIQHIRSLLGGAGLGDENVLSALVYCKTPRVEEAFHRDWADLAWPAFSMIGDVCRDDLLFEIELVAGEDRKE